MTHPVIAERLKNAEDSLLRKVLKLYESPDVSSSGYYIEPTAGNEGVTMGQWLAAVKTELQDRSIRWLASMTEEKEETPVIQTPVSPFWPECERW